jgi:curli biogenesis system outer membrane secretion channel CsgG
MMTKDRERKKKICTDIENLNVCEFEDHDWRIGIMMKSVSRSMVLLAIALLLAACTTAGGSTNVREEEEAVYPPYSGPKKRLAVLEFDNKVSNRWWDRSWNIEERLTEMVITELMNTNRFIVVERGALNEVLTEQDLGESGRIRTETAARVGEVLGAQVLVKGAVTEFIEKESGGAGGIVISGIGIGGKTNTGHVAIDMRLIDATTGQILQSHRAEGQIKSTGIGGIAFFKGVVFGGTTFKKTALGQATRASVKDAVRFVVENMEDQAWQGRVVKVDGGKIYINAGSNMNISNDMVFTVYAKGEELIDPDTGLSLGSTMSRSGTVRVIQVADKFSVAQTIEGSGFKTGDILKMQ